MSNSAKRSPQRRPREFAMPVPMIFSVRIRTPRQQAARGLNQPSRTLWRTMVQTRVTDIKERFPILHSTGLRGKLRRGLGMRPQPLLHRRRITKHQFGIEAGVSDGRVSLEQSKRAGRRAAGGATQELVHSRFKR